MLRYFYEAQSAGKIPERNLCVVRYEDLINDLEPTMERILDFIEIKPTEAFVDEVREQAARQRSYTSRHEHSPQQFGIAPERIRSKPRVCLPGVRAFKSGGPADIQPRGSGEPGTLV